MAHARTVLLRRSADSTRVAGAGDFLLGRSKQLTLREAFFGAPESLSPYALDADRGEVSFVRTQAGVDPAEAHPFFYAAQRRHAVELVVAPFAEVEALADDLGSVSTRFAFLYSAGRAGSTVTGKLAERLPGVQALSEPDVFTHVAMQRLPGDAERDARLVRIAGAVARVLYAHRAAVDPGRRIVLVKQRGLGVFGAELLHRALPEAKTLFLDRDPAAIVDSYLGAFLGHPLVELGRRIGLDRLATRVVRAAVPFTHPHLAHAMPDVVRAAPGSDDGAVELLALAVRAMNEAVLHLERSGSLELHARLRYEDLVTRPMSFARTLASALDIPNDASLVRALSSIDGVLRVDAQQGSRVQSRGERSLGHDEVARVRRLVATNASGAALARSEAL